MHAIKCKSNPQVSQGEGRFPDVIDVMIKVISNEGAKILERYENGDMQRKNQRNSRTRNTGGSLPSNTAKLISGGLRFTDRESNSN